MTPQSQLLADLRQLEDAAYAHGMDAARLRGAIERLTLLVMGLPIARLDSFLRAQQLVERGLAVKIACSRAGLSRDAYYRLLQILRHHPCDPPGVNDLSWRNPVTRIVKNRNNTLGASDVAPVPVSGNGKPTWTPPAVPRADGGLSTGKTGGNYDAAPAPSVATPSDLLDRPGTGNV